MKKVSLFLAIVAIFVSAFATVAVWQHISHERKAPNADEMISQITEKITNPEFANPEDVLGYQMGMVQKAEADQIFANMTEKDVYNAFSVCKNTLGKVTKMDLVHEYLKHKSVYDNLPNDAQKDSIAPASETNKTSKDISPGDSTVKGNGSNVRVIIEQKLKSMKNFIIITTSKQDVVTPQLAVHLRTFLETRNIPVACVVEMNEKELINAITSSETEAPSVEIPQVVINSIKKVNDVIIRMRKAGVSNHDITNAIAVATIVDGGMNKNLDILKENIQYVSPDIRVIIDPIWQGHTSR